MIELNCSALEDELAGRIRSTTSIFYFTEKSAIGTQITGRYLQNTQISIDY